MIPEDNTVYYGSLATLGLVGIVGLLYCANRLKEEVQKIQKETQDKLREERQRKNDQDCHHLIASFQAGLVQYKKFDKTPLKVSEMGIRNGFMTWYRHADASKYEQFHEIIAKINDVAALKKEIVSFVVDEGCIWSQTRGANHHMTNFFLQNLKNEDFALYAEMIEACYNVKLLHGKQTLYRRDTRPMLTIFEEGFQPKQNNHNAPETRRSNFAQQRTEDYGVSLSKGIPPTEFGLNGYYVIHIPADHRLQLIDIIESPRNKMGLSLYRLRLKEVNSIDAIPREYIHGFYTSYGKFIPNPHYGKPVRTIAQNEPTHRSSSFANLLG